MSEALEFIQGLVGPYRGVLAIGIGLLLVYRLFGSSLAPLLQGVSWAWPAAKGTVAPVDQDGIDLAAFKTLKARMVRLKCKEGQAALDTVGHHFLTDHSAEG